MLSITLHYSIGVRRISIRQQFLEKIVKYREYLPIKKQKVIYFKTNTFYPAGDTP